VSTVCAAENSHRAKVSVYPSSSLYSTLSSPPDVCVYMNVFRGLANIILFICRDPVFVQWEWQ
jgi:hypothetical protein